MSYVINLLSKELSSLDNRIKCKRQALEGLTTQVHDVTVEIYQLELLRDEILDGIENQVMSEEADDDFYYECDCDCDDNECDCVVVDVYVVDDVDDDLPIRLEGSE